MGGGAAGGGVCGVSLTELQGVGAPPRGGRGGRGCRCCYRGVVVSGPLNAAKASGGQGEVLLLLLLMLLLVLVLRMVCRGGGGRGLLLLLPRAKRAAAIAAAAAVQKGGKVGLEWRQLGELKGCGGCHGRR